MTNIFKPTPADYLKILEHSFDDEVLCSECPPESRLSFVGDHIFDFTTYDDVMSAMFAAEAIKVALAISADETHEYIKDPSNYSWYLLMCNMPFFSEKIEWGTSIRGAWWDHDPTEKLFVESYVLYVEGKQLGRVSFTKEHWKLFIAALDTFTAEERKELEAAKPITLDVKDE